MKNKFLIVFIVLVLLLGFFMAYQNKKVVRIDNKDNTPDTETRLKFTDPNNEFTFEYSPLLKASEGVRTITHPPHVVADQPGILLAQVYARPGSDFNSARLTIGRSSDPRVIPACLTAGNNGNYKISGFPFTRSAETFQVGGETVEATSYLGSLDGDCYEIEYQIYSTGALNTNETNAFDKSKIKNEMETIIKSFKFLVNSD